MIGKGGHVGDLFCLVPLTRFQQHLIHDETSVPNKGGEIKNQKYVRNQKRNHKGSSFVIMLTDFDIS